MVAGVDRRTEKGVDTGVDIMLVWWSLVDRGCRYGTEVIDNLSHEGRDTAVAALSPCYWASQPALTGRSKHGKENWPQVQRVHSQHTVTNASDRRSHPERLRLRDHAVFHNPTTTSPPGQDTTGCPAWSAWGTSTTTGRGAARCRPAVSGSGDCSGYPSVPSRPHGLANRR